jgi:hypothetical protein
VQQHYFKYFFMRIIFLLEIDFIGLKTIYALLLTGVFYCQAWILEYFTGFLEADIDEEYTDDLPVTMRWMPRASKVKIDGLRQRLDRVRVEDVSGHLMQIGVRTTPLMIVLYLRVILVARPSYTDTCLSG